MLFFCLYVLRLLIFLPGWTWTLAIADIYNKLFHWVIPRQRYLFFHFKCDLSFSHSLFLHFFCARICPYCRGSSGLLTIVDDRPFSNTLYHPLNYRILIRFESTRFGPKNRTEFWTFQYEVSKFNAMAYQYLAWWAEGMSDWAPPVLHCNIAQVWLPFEK